MVILILGKLRCIHSISTQRIQIFLNPNESLQQQPGLTSFLIVGLRGPGFRVGLEDSILPGTELRFTYWSC